MICEPSDCSTITPNSVGFFHFLFYITSCSCVASLVAMQCKMLYFLYFFINTRFVQATAQFLKFGQQIIEQRELQFWGMLGLNTQFCKTHVPLGIYLESPNMSSPRGESSIFEIKKVWKHVNYNY